MKGPWCRLRSLTLMLLLALLVSSLYPAPSFAVRSSAMDDVSTLTSVPPTAALLLPGASLSSTAVHTPLRSLLSITPNTGVVVSMTEPLTPTAMLDLEWDADGDGIPDELFVAVDHLFTQMEQAGDTPATRAALLDLQARLPYAAETRALQQEGAALLTQLLTEDDPARQRELHAQMAALEARMLTDPHYARVMDALPLILAARRDAAEAAPEPAAAIRSDYAVFLPVVIRGSSGTGGTPSGPPAGFTPRKGDIFLVNGSGSSSGLSWTDFVYKVWWGHTGVYDGDDFIYESIDTGVELRNFPNNWLTSGNDIWQGRAKKSELRPKVVTSLDSAKAKYSTDGSTPYNFNFVDKTTDEALYCSQLAWKIYQDVGLDIDSNNPNYANALALKWAGKLPPFIIQQIAQAAVAPDEIFLDSDMITITAFTIPKSEE